jgi:hypothetical protein
LADLVVVQDAPAATDVDDSNKENTPPARDQQCKLIFLYSYLLGICVASFQLKI